MALENFHLGTIVWSMAEASEYRTGRHVIFKLHVHLVFVTKYRRGVITDRVRAFLKEAMEKVCLDFEADLMAFDGEDDHVHLLIAYPPKVAISSLVNSLKGASAYRLKAQQFTEVQRKLWGKHFWSPSYCAVSCGGAALETVKTYIQDQRKDSKGTA
jgi:putative transposase